MKATLISLAAIGCATFAQAPSDGKPGPGAAGSAPGGSTQLPLEDALTRAVVLRLKEQPVGDVPLAALCIPDEFLTRVAERISAMEYQRQFRSVSMPAAAAASSSTASPSSSDASTRPPGPQPSAGQSHGKSSARRSSSRLPIVVAVVVLGVLVLYLRRRRARDAAGPTCIVLLCPLLASSPASAQSPAPTVITTPPWLESFYPRSSAERRAVALRGFRASIVQTDRLRPENAPGEDAPPAVRAAYRHVAEHLACDGLLPTAVRAMDMLHSAGLTRSGAEGDALLADIGFPVDLLGHFETSPTAPPGGITAEIRERLAAGESTERLISETAGRAFTFRPTNAAFRLSAESGASDALAVRMHVEKTERWRGPGDGSAIDVAERIAHALPDARLVIATAPEEARKLAAVAAGWTSAASPRSTAILSCTLAPSQWAQDNGKSGVLAAAPGTSNALATLVPRYASRGEERTLFDPAESLAAAMLPLSGVAVVHSPLLFQGGNLMLVDDAARKKRVLLIGEAEIYRNTALGLSRQQAIDALRIECSADEAVVLPAVSFHIDMDLCVRAHRGKVIAFVNDELAAARLIAETAAAALKSAGVIPADTADKVLAALRAGKDAEAVDHLGAAVAPLAGADGAYPLAVAERLAASKVESGVGNFERFLLAIDILACAQLGTDEMPSAASARQYIAALKAREADRRLLWEEIRKLGWTLIPVPSLARESRGINYVNGFHLPGRYLMPAYGGVYEPVDQAAAAVIREALDGDVEITPILCGETQRRLGAIHCVAALYPKE